MQDSLPNKPALQSIDDHWGFEFGLFNPVVDPLMILRHLRYLGWVALTSVNIVSENPQVVIRHETVKH